MNDLPKTELHLHLEGAAPPAFIRDLAHKKHKDISGVFDETGGYVQTDFWEFLKVYEAATSVLETPQDYHDLTLAVLQESAAHGVVYSETFVSPDFCGGGDVLLWKEYLNAMSDAAETAERDFGITLRAIVTCIRHFGPEKAKAAAHCAVETAGRFLTGFGIAGDEKQHRPQDFAWSFDCAREAGLGLTAHAGEWDGPQSVRDALTLGVSRIGHGVRAIEDARLVEELAAKDVTLEVCPGSNVVLGVYCDWKSHPIRELDRNGVKVTISTDDPPFFRTTLSHEYDQLSKTFEWDNDVFRRLNRNAMNAAFCDATTKSAILKKLEPAS